MKKWNIPVSWEVCGIVTIEANTLKEAMDKIRKDDSIPLPQTSQYVDGSFDLSCNEEEVVREFYNDNKKNVGEDT